jgi:aminoglycoside 6'-N-acetyltransferase
MVTLRKATIADREILELWDQQPHVMDSDPNDDWNWAYELTRDPDWREQLIAEVDGRPVGIVQIIDPALEESHYWGEIDTGYRAIDIWIGMENDLAKGYGTQMMMQALDRCFQDASVKEVLIDPLESNVKAIQFYERLGFEFVEARTFGADDCKVYRYTRESWEINKSK